MSGRGGFTVGFVAATVGLVVGRSAAWWGAVLTLLALYLAGVFYVEWCQRQAAARARCPWIMRTTAGQEAHCSLSREHEGRHLFELKRVQP